jgi:hypothetical protein
MSKVNSKFSAPLAVQKAFTGLCGLLEGMDADKVINSLEIKSLTKWFSENNNLEKKKPFDEIFAKFSEIMADGKIARGIRKLDEKDIGLLQDQSMGLIEAEV